MNICISSLAPCPTSSPFHAFNDGDESASKSNNDKGNFSNCDDENNNDNKTKLSFKASYTLPEHRKFPFHLPGVGARESLGPPGMGVGFGAMTATKTAPPETAGK